MLIAFSLRYWLLLALGASIAMLAIAHAFQTFAGLQPCHLCLQQRTVYWVAIGVSAVALAVDGVPAAARHAHLFGWLLALIFLTGAVIAIRHAGAEWGFWPAPQSCAAGRLAAGADLAALLNGAKFAAPSCDVAAWRFLGLSMAGWNALISLKLTGWSIAFALFGQSRTASPKALPRP